LLLAGVGIMATPKIKWYRTPLEQLNMAVLLNLLLMSSAARILTLSTNVCYFKVESQFVTDVARK